MLCRERTQVSGCVLVFVFASRTLIARVVGVVMESCALIVSRSCSAVARLPRGSRWHVTFTSVSRQRTTFWDPSLSGFLSPTVVYVTNGRVHPSLLPAVFSFARRYCIRINEEAFLQVVPRVTGLGLDNGLGYLLSSGGRPIRSQLISSYDHDICGGRMQKWSTGPLYNQHRDDSVDVHNLNLNIHFFAVHKQPQEVQI